MLVMDETGNNGKSRTVFLVHGTLTASNCIAFHCAIAMMDTLNAFFRDAKVLSPQTSWHLAQATRSVSHRLDSVACFDESSLLVVNFMIVQGLVQENLASTLIHRNGLVQMIELGGGLSSLTISHTLRVKICKYVELYRMSSWRY